MRQINKINVFIYLLFLMKSNKNISASTIEKHFCNVSNYHINKVNINVFDFQRRIIKL